MSASRVFSFLLLITILISVSFGKSANQTKNDVMALMNGGWSGVVLPILGDQYNIEFNVWNNQYSCHSLDTTGEAAKALCFGYGSDWEYSDKLFFLDELKGPDGWVGSIYIYTYYGVDSTKGYVVGSIRKLVVNEVKLSFEIWDSFNPKPTPIYVSLKRQSVHPPRMCSNYCDGDGFCNFTTTSCKYTQYYSENPNVPLNATTNYVTSVSSGVGFGIVVACIVLGSLLIVTGAGIAIWVLLKKRQENLSYTQLQMINSDDSQNPMFVIASPTKN